jgi:glycosyltransferase involved in cell wall biosynthesis
MRILLIVPEFPPHAIGGGGVAYEAIARTLERRGHEIVVLSGDCSGKRVATAHDGSIRVVRVATFSGPRTMPYLRGYLPPRNPSDFLARLERESRAADVIHIHSMASTFCDLAGHYLRMRGRAYHVTNHGIPARPARAGAVTGALFRGYMATMTMPVVAGAKAISAISAFCAGDPPLRGRRVEVIPNGLEPRDYPVPQQHRRDVAFFAGRITADKGPLMLVEASARVPGLQVEFAGPDDGELQVLQTRIEALGIGERVRYLGVLSRAQVLERMRTSRSFVFPSMNEPFGLAGLEAMASGAVLIHSDRGGMTTYTGADRSIAFATGSIEALAAALRTVHDPAFPAQEVGSRARDYALTQTWDAVCARYEAWYAG